MAKRSKSVFESLGGALSSRRRKGKGKGLASMLPYTSRKKKGRGKKDLASHMNLGKGFGSGGRRRRRSSGGGIAKWAGKAIRDRLTPTERQEVRQEAEEAIQNDDQLNEMVRDAELTGNKAKIEGLISIISRTVAKLRFNKMISPPDSKP